MAADQTNKRRNITTEFAAAVNKMMEGYEVALTLEAEMDSANMTFVDTDFIGDLIHVDTTVLTQARNQLKDLKATFMEPASGAKPKAKLDKIRP